MILMSPRFEIQDAKVWHCGIMARKLREETRDALKPFDSSAHRRLRDQFDRSTFRKAVLINGELAALGGVIGMSMESTGEVWLAFSNLVGAYPIKIIKETMRQLRALLETKHSLKTTLLPGDERATRMAMLLGFHIVHPLPFEKGEIVRAEIVRPFQQARVPRPGATFAPFIIYTAGRSRTAWLSRFLTYGECRCHDEIAIRFRTVEEIRTFFADPRNGSSETAAAPGWRIVEKLAPGINAVVVRRDAESIIRSFARSEVAHIASIDEDRLRRIIAYEERCLEKISRQPNVLTVDFNDLDRATVCREIFEHCLPYKFDFAWWESLKDVNIQSSVVDIFNYYRQHKDEVEGLKRDAKRVLTNLVRAGELHAVH